MFLDDELNEIAKDGLGEETSRKLIKACVKRLPKPDNVVEYCNALKRTDVSWRLFCKKNKQYNEEGFRTYILRCCITDDDARERFRKSLRW